MRGRSSNWLAATRSSRSRVISSRALIHTSQHSYHSALLVLLYSFVSGSTTRRLLRVCVIYSTTSLLGLLLLVLPAFQQQHQSIRNFWFTLRCVRGLFPPLGQGVHVLPPWVPGGLLLVVLVVCSPALGLPLYDIHLYIYIFFDILGQWWCGARRERWEKTMGIIYFVLQIRMFTPNCQWCRKIGIFAENIFSSNTDRWWWSRDAQKVLCWQMFPSLKSTNWRRRFCWL